MSIFENTTLIIGAGAHVPYGFPTSQQLTRTIKQLVSTDAGGITSASGSTHDHWPEIRHDKHRIAKLILDADVITRPSNPRSSNEHDINIGKVLDEFVLSFGRSQVYSIDAYLKVITESGSENDGLKAKIGKLLISYFIKKSEDRCPIGFHYEGFDWIQYIINEFLTKDLKKFFECPPRVFSFNYDNLFERSIWEHLVHYHKMSEQQAKQMVLGLKIRHIYGHIGTLENPFLLTDVRGHLAAINNIKVIGEERDTAALDGMAEEIIDSILHADQVLFLGFGFDDLNTQLIYRKLCKEPDTLKDIQEYCRHQRRAATNIGRSLHEIQSLQKRLPFFIDFHATSQGLEQIDCLKLIREKAPIFQPSPKRGMTRLASHLRHPQ